MPTSFAEQTKGKARTGRPKEINYRVLATDDAQALEKSKVQWQYLSLKLAQQCESYIKKGDTPPAQLLTQAAIAYDKAFAKRDVSDTQVTIPKSLELAWIKALKQPFSTSDNVRYGKLDNTPVSDPGPGTVDSTTEIVQGPAHDSTPTPIPGVGLQPVPVVAAAAAQPDLSPALKTEISLEPQKDLVPEPVTAPVLDPGQEQITDRMGRSYVRTKHQGPKRFQDPFKDPV